MDYDQRAVAYVARLQQTLAPRTRRDSAAMEIGALMNALEVHVENGLGHPNVVRAYENLLLALATLRAVDTAHVKKAQAIFNDLRQYLHQTTAGT